MQVVRGVARVELSALEVASMSILFNIVIETIIIKDVEVERSKCLLFSGTASDNNIRQHIMRKIAYTAFDIHTTIHLIQVQRLVQQKSCVWMRVQEG
jgi:hypothetical protein